MYEFANYFFFCPNLKLLVSHDSCLVFLCRFVCVPVCFFFFNPPALPHYKLFETQAQLIVVTEEFGIRRDLIQKDLRHLQRALRKHKEAGDKNKDAGLDGEREKLS